MTAERLPRRQADFIRFWRDIFQGRLPTGLRIEDAQEGPFSLRAETIRLLQRDLATICVSFLLNQGGVLPQLRLVGGVHTAQEGRVVFGDATSTAAIAFTFSQSWGEYLVCAYEGREFEASGRTFQVADALALVVLLDRLYPPDGGPSLLGRSGLIGQSSLAGLIAAMSLATICFFDHLPMDVPPFSLRAPDEAELLCEVLGALAPFIRQRWQLIDRNAWQPGHDPRKLARLLRKREQIATALFGFCRNSNRIEILSIFAQLVESTLSIDFFDVDRSFSRIIDWLETSIDKALDLPGPHFSQIFRLRGPCPPGFLPVETILDNLGRQDSPLRSWRSNDLLGFLFEIPDNRVHRDLSRLAPEKFAGGVQEREQERALVQSYLKNQVESWFGVFFNRIHHALYKRLADKCDRVGDDQRRDLCAWIAGKLKSDIFDRYSLEEAISYWMLWRRVQIRFEDRYLAREQSAALPTSWNRRRKKERLLEQKLMHLLDSPQDNICTWAEELRLDREQDRQELIEDVLAGFAFVGQIRELEKWAATLDTYDEQENALRNIAMTVLAAMAEPGRRKKLYERYDRLASVIGFEL